MIRIWSRDKLHVETSNSSRDQPESEKVDYLAAQLPMRIYFVRSCDGSYFFPTPAQVVILPCKYLTNYIVILEHGTRALLVFY